MLPPRHYAFPAVVATLLVTLPSGPEAHLSIIRQGLESQGVPEALDLFGSVLCTGDFNGDGFDDLATSAPYEDLGGYPGNDHGAVIINWGSPEGLTHVGAQLVLPTISENGLLFGFSMASADFDQDGFVDLVVGMPFANQFGNSDSGVIAVYRGGVLGFVNAPVLYNQTHIGSAAEAGDKWGFALAAGDLNGDGYPDLAVGSPGENGAGSVVFLFSSSTGLSTTGSYGVLQSTYGGTNGAGDNFGAAITIGNFGGLSTLDVAIGCPNKDNFGTFGISDMGMVAVILSSSSGPDPSQATEHTQISMGLSGAADSGRRLGHALAAGDFNNDGYDDLAVGRPGSSSYAGEVVELHGAAAGVTYHSTRTSNDFIGSTAPGDRFAESLATGDFDDDGFKDLLVGSPGHKQLSFTSMGRVYLYRATLGFGLAAFTDFQHADLNVNYAAFDEVGKSVAFGYFDDTGRANMVAGAPGAEGNSGRVHVMAPWRQPGRLQCRNSVQFDCDGNFVYSQKPFDPVYTASTAKNMTILIACERTQLPTNHPNYVHPQTVYEVPDWVADDIGGSQFNLVEGELVTLRTLMDMTMSVSGNDAAYAIADLLTGGNNTFNGYFNTVPAFVAEMNTRAVQLGMFNTTFTNPPGVSGTVPESTAYDMAILGRAAIQNPLFEAVVNNPNWNIVRVVPSVFGGYVAFDQFVGGGFVAALQSWLPQAIGSKDGGTPAAGITGVFQARESFYPWGIAFGSSFNTPTYLPLHVQDAASLMALGLDRCFNGPGYFTEFNPTKQETGPFSATALITHAASFYPPDPIKKEAYLEVHNLVLDGLDTEVNMQVQRVSTAAVPDLQTVHYATENVTGHEGITVAFAGALGSSVMISTNTTGNPSYNLFLQPGDVFEIPAASLPTGVTQFTMSIWASSAQFAHLRITENYSEDLVLDGSPGSAPVKEAIVFLRDGSGNVLPERVNVVLTGQDNDPGHEVGLALHEFDPDYVYDVCPASSQNYGEGWSGANGTPTLTTDSSPVLGSLMHVRFGNSMDGTTSGLWAIGFAKDSFQTAVGGTLHLDPAVLVPVSVPAEGFEFPLSIPSEPAFCGIAFYNQLFVVDPSASHGFSFSRGLELRIGN